MIAAVVVLSAVGLASAIGLAYATRRFRQADDPRVEEAYGLLPNVNCGACGFPSCLEYARHVVKDSALIGQCRVGGQKTADALAAMLKAAPVHADRMVARVYCKGGTHAKEKCSYRGAQSCAAASIVAEGQKLCRYACLGFGDCVKACSFGALRMADGLPHVDADRCTSCGRCVTACPRGIMVVTKAQDTTIIACRSHDGAKKVVASCGFGCIACGACVRACPTKAIMVKDNLAVVDFSKCTHCGKCAAVCPRKVIDILA